MTIYVTQGFTAPYLWHSFAIQVTTRLLHTALSCSELTIVVIFDDCMGAKLKMHKVPGKLGMRAPNSYPNKQVAEG